jgi:DNA invertase Pin-like site-specific DNA recombinase
VQRRAIDTYCAAQGIEVLATYQDLGISGSANLDERPGLAAALAAAEAHCAEQVLVYRLDRLARDLILQELLLARLSKRGTAVVSVTEPDIDSMGSDPTKVLIRQILGALGQYERALIRGRMDAGRAVKAAGGGYVGGAPSYGFGAVDGMLTQIESELTVVALIRDLRSQGRSLREICVALDAAGHKPRRANKWHPTVVRSIALRR